MSCNFERPTQFSQEALDSKLIAPDGTETDLGTILEKHKDKVIFLDLWASWCKDCLLAIPDLKALQRDFPDVEYIFLSYDRSMSAWRSSMKRYGLNGEHYYVPSGWDGPLGDFIRLNWIPRYMVIDKDGTIKLFKATRAKDQSIKDALL